MTIRFSVINEGIHNLGHKSYKISFYPHFAPPYPCAMLEKDFHLTQVFILPFFNIERENGGVDTYSIGIAILSYYNFMFGIFQYNLSMVAVSTKQNV